MVHLHLCIIRQCTIQNRHLFLYTNHVCSLFTISAQNTNLMCGISIFNLSDFRRTGWKLLNRRYLVFSLALNERLIVLFFLLDLVSQQNEDSTRLRAGHLTKEWLGIPSPQKTPYKEV